MISNEIKEQMINWRHQIHCHPEAAFEEKETSSLVAKVLTDLGLEVHTGIGGTGVVGVLRCGSGARRIGLRADMDCNKIVEQGEHPYTSQNHGRMHACGHDGHTATLLGVAAALSQSRDFNGTVYFIFQPAEEPGLGAQAMLDDGLLERFPMDEVYGFHNFPNLPKGTVSVRPGQFMASEDDFKISIHGKGGHSSAPHDTKDPLVAAAEMIMAMQTIVSRNVDAQEPAVLSFTELHTDGAMNAIPSNVTLSGDVRTYSAQVQSMIEAKMRQICEHICGMNDMAYEFEYIHAFVPMVNDEELTNQVVEAAKQIVGSGNVNSNANRISGSEDFARISAKVPGCYFALGSSQYDDPNVEPPLHNALFNYNDDILVLGAELLVQIVHQRLTV